MNAVVPEDFQSSDEELDDSDSSEAFSWDLHSSDIDISSTDESLDENAVNTVGKSRKRKKTRDSLENSVNESKKNRKSSSLIDNNDSLLSFESLEIDELTSDFHCNAHPCPRLSTFNKVDSLSAEPVQNVEEPSCAEFTAEPCKNLSKIKRKNEEKSTEVILTTVQGVPLDRYLPLTMIQRSDGKYIIALIIM